WHKDGGHFRKNGRNHSPSDGVEFHRQVLRENTAFTATHSNGHDRGQLAATGPTDQRAAFAPSGAGGLIVHLDFLLGTNLTRSFFAARFSAARLSAHFEQGLRINGNSHPAREHSAGDRSGADPGAT